MNLYEHQSTYCPNMPIRGLIYIASIYQAFISENNLNIYGSKLIQLPTPQYVVFYNGLREINDIEKMRLSEAFESENGCLELEATIININAGHNEELMKHCQKLYEYSEFINILRKNQTKTKSLEEAINKTCIYCIENDILKSYLEKNRNDVCKVLLTEYDFKEHMKMERRDSLEAGREAGREE